MSDRWEGLRRLAAQATPGPWLLATSNSWRRFVSEHPQHWGNVCEPTIQRHDNHPDLHFRNGGVDGPDAKWIAAANPSAIADLLAERDRLAAEVVHFAGRLADAERDRDQFKHQWEQQCGIARTATDKLMAANTERDEAIRSSDAVCDSYAEENQRLSDELAEARRDAERYRWLRSTVNLDEPYYHFVPVDAWDFRPGPRPNNRFPDLDAAIDAAMGRAE